MGLVATLLAALVPKSFTALLLYASSAAAIFAAWYVVPMRTVLRLCAREDPDTLLRELTAKEKNRNKPNKRRSASKSKSRNVLHAKSEEIEDEEQEHDDEHEIAENPIEVSENDEDLLIKKALAQRDAVIAAKAVTSRLENHHEGESSTEPWQRVPTREEAAQEVLRNNIQQLTDSLETMQQSNVSLQSRVAAECKRANEAEAESRERSRTSQMRWMAQESQVVALREQVLRLEDAKQLTEMRISELEGKNIEVVQYNERLTTDLCSKDEIIAAISQKLSIIETKFIMAEKANVELEEKLNASQYEVSLFSAKMTELSSAVEESKNECNELKAEISSKIDTIAELNSHIENGKNEAATQVNEKLVAKEREAIELSFQLEESVKRTVILSQQLATKEECLIGIQKEREGLLDEVRKCETKLSQTVEELTSLKEASLKASEDSTARNDTIAYAQGEMAAMREVLIKRDEEAGRLKDEMASIEDERSKIKEEVESLKAQLAQPKENVVPPFDETLAKELNELREKCNDLQKRHDITSKVLEQKTAHYKNQIAALTQDRDSIKEHLAATQRDLQNLHKTESEVAQVTEQLVELVEN